MYRVVTKYRDRGGARPIVERGPWHASRQTAEYWAEVMRQLGYIALVETQQGIGGGGGGDDDDHSALADALASMA